MIDKYSLLILFQQLLNMSLQDMETGLYHGNMIMPIKLIEIGFLVTSQFHHTCQILILIVSTQELLLTITTIFFGSPPYSAA